MPTEPRICPACGAPVEADTAFCGECDSLVSSTAENRPNTGARMPLVPIPVVRPAPPPSATQPPAQSVARPPAPLGPWLTIDCWNCDTPNTPSRMFCVACGSFIAVGSGASATGAGRPARSGADASDPALIASAEQHPGAPLEEAPAPFVEGAMTLGPYSIAARRRAVRRARTLTAVTSVVLASVVGLAALYVAAPWGDRSGEPRTGAADVTSATSAPASAAAAGPGAEADSEDDETRTLSGAAAEPDGPTLAQPVPASLEALPAEAQAVETLPGAVDTDADPAGPDRPATQTQDRSAIDTPDGSAIGNQDRAATTGLEPALTDAPEDAASATGGWVCGGPVRVEDSRVRAWSLGRVSFRARPGFERVILHLERAGPGSGAPPSVVAQAVPTARLNSLFPAVRRPALGRSTIGLRLADGIDGNLGLRGYRPSGLVDIKEFSVYPAGGGDSSVIISTSSGGCFRLRVPAWSDPSASVRRADILVDVKS